MEIFTIGYEKRTIEEYIDILVQNDITVLVDVRETAWSYKRDFCKKKFSSRLIERGVKYVHLKQLGNPKAIRRKELPHSEILQLYKNYLHGTNAGIKEFIDRFCIGALSGDKICLTCFELDSRCCHRRIITDYLANVLTPISVIHL